MEQYISKLNQTHAALTAKERLSAVFDEFGQERVLITSSFGTSSVYLLSLVQEVSPGKEIYFIDTSFHFRETYVYKEYLTAYFNLNVIDLIPHKLENEFTRVNKLWKTDPDRCCGINKVTPLEDLKKKHTIWVSGLMKFQNSHREKKKLFEENGIIRFYPVIDTDKEELTSFIHRHNLPQHPLAVNGYDSIGCIHCTKKGVERAGRWDKFEKTECGLHEDYLDKNKKSA